MIECIATDVATMMADMTDLQFQAEQVSGERLNSNHSAATGVKAALHKLVKKYAGDETAERLLGAPAKPSRKSEMSTTRRSRCAMLCCAMLCLAVTATRQALVQEQLTGVLVQVSFWQQTPVPMLCFALCYALLLCVTWA